MELLNMNLPTMAYVESDAEFDRARMKGFWERLLSRFTHQPLCLQAFDEAIKSFSSSCMTDLGIQDVSLNKIIGSVGRNHDFTRQFLPCHKSKSGRERWRKIYTLIVTGTGIPPVELYKVGDDYFVEDGHHRVSVAKYLGWEVIQAQIVELSLSETARLESSSYLKLCGGIM